MDHQPVEPDTPDAPIPTEPDTIPPSPDDERARPSTIAGSPARPEYQPPQARPDTEQPEDTHPPDANGPLDEGMEK